MFYFALGNRQYEKHNYKKAIEYYNKQISMWPEMPQGYIVRGGAKMHLKDIHGAINDYDIAIKLNQKEYKVYGYRGYAKYELKDYRGSIDDYNQGISINPNDNILYNNRGWSKYCLGDYKGAIEDSRKSLKLKPLSYAYSTHANALIKLGIIKDACSDLLKAKKLGYGNTAHGKYFEKENDDLIYKYCN